MIVVKEEQGDCWTRSDPVVEGGGSTRTPETASSTMLKEEQQQQQVQQVPNLPSSEHLGVSNNNNNSILHSNLNGPSPVGQGHHYHHHSSSSGVNNLSSGSGGGNNSSSNICAGCGQRIFDRYYVLAVDRQWHNECLKCHRCGAVLSGHTTCFARDGLILCKDDYYRTYQQLPRRACARCGNGIGSRELIMRAKDLVYHLNCFVCVVCLHVLNKGDHFGMRNSALYCQKHYEMVLEENSGSSPPPPNLAPNSPHHHHSHGVPQLPSPLSNHHPLHHPSTPFFNGAGSGQKGRPRKRKDPTAASLTSVIEIGATTPPGMQHLTQNLDMMGDPTGVHGNRGSIDEYDSSSTCPGGMSGGQQRTKRMRTSFKHHQLRTMKSYFAINQNPDAKDLKQLAQKTGLSKRVLQVWFQNARAKWRRNMLRSESNKSGGTTPTRDDELQINPNSMTPGTLDMLSTGGGSDDGGFSSDVY